MTMFMTYAPRPYRRTVILLSDIVYVLRWCFWNIFADQHLLETCRRISLSRR
jgi:hypothetical protein